MSTNILQTNVVNRITNFQSSGNGVCLEVTDTSGGVEFPPLADGSPFTDVMITNAGENTAFFTFGETLPTAAIPTNGSPANGIAILAGQTLAMGKGSATFMAAITTSGATTLYAYQGYGS